MAKIVVVEDQPLLGQFLVESLEAVGHDVRFTQNGDEAIDLGYLFQPEVLITDWDLGNEYDGVEVAAACQFANENIKTIVISGHEKRLKEFETDTRIFKTLAKPFTLDRLVQCVNEAVV